MIYNIILFVFKNKYFQFLSCPRTIYLCKHPVRFWLMGPHGLNNRILIPWALMRACTSYTWGASPLPLTLMHFRVCGSTMSYCNSECVIEVKEYAYPNFWESGVWMSRFPKWKSKLCSLWIICTIILLLIKNQYFRLLSYPELHICASTGFDYRWLTRWDWRINSYSVNFYIYIDLRHLA
jgi:hypothetical protein